MSFNKQRTVTVFFGDRSYPVQEHGLAHAAEPNENHAFGWTTCSQAMKRNSGLLQNGVTANQFRRRRTCARRERILKGVHIESLSLYTKKVLYADNFCIFKQARCQP